MSVGTWRVQNSWTEEGWRKEAYPFLACERNVAGHIALLSEGARHGYGVLENWYFPT